MRTAPHGRFTWHVPHCARLVCFPVRCVFPSGVFSRRACFPVGRVFPSGVLFHIAACFLHDIRLLIYIKRPVPPSPIGAAHRFLFCYKYGSGRISASLAPFFSLQAPVEPELFRGYADFRLFFSFPRRIFGGLTRIFGFSSLFRVNHFQALRGF